MGTVFVIISDHLQPLAVAMQNC